MPEEPVAYFLTWTVRGSWLHGDERGSIDPRHRDPGTPGVPRSMFLSDFERDSLKSRVLAISPAMRTAIEESLNETCTARGWSLIALNVRTTHIHAVVSATDYSPERVLNDFKAWSTRRLKRDGLIGHDARPWTRHGSTRRLWNEDSVVQARSYVLHHQGVDLPGSVFEPPPF